MDIFELADKIRSNFEIQRNMHDGKFYCGFPGAEIIDPKSQGLEGVFGIGETVAESLRDYVGKIRGKLLVQPSLIHDIEPLSQIKVPKNLRMPKKL